MAYPRFDYPDSASPTSSLIFTEGGRLLNDIPSLKINQNLERTDSGAIMAESMGPIQKQYPFTAVFKRSSESETDLDDIIDWIENVAEGAVNTFDWTEADGTVRPVKMVNDTIEFPPFGADVKCTFILEEQS